MIPLKRCFDRNNVPQLICDDCCGHYYYYYYYVKSKYIKSERSKVIFKSEAKFIIREIRNDFQNSSPQFKFRILNTCKFSVEYNEEDDLYYLEAPIKYKKQIRRHPVVCVEDIFERIHKIHFDRGQAGKNKLPSKIIFAL